ncbi:MAG: hypothetical protein OEM67_05690 [Thermoleophilia bacterium]|nr:hypothetical protein [Thermoleophilia bacterium]
MTAFFGAVDDRVESATELLTELPCATSVPFVAHLFASRIGGGRAIVALEVALHEAPPYAASVWPRRNTSS